ncbi:MAG: histidine phosphatase family protein [Planctomycetaceae bacterium]
MKTIALMRHSHAVSDNSAWSDYERPLSAKGRELALATADLLKDLRPDRIICSSAERTLETSQIVARATESDGRVLSHEALYLAPADVYVAAARDDLTAEDNTVLIVGHNPGIAGLMCNWAQESLSVSPATVAIFRFHSDDWQALHRVSHEILEWTGLISNGIRVK